MKVFAHYFGRPGLSHPTFIKWELKKRFESAGVKFTRKSEADEIWVFDLSLASLVELIRWPRARRRLFIFEPKAVNPLQHRDWARRLFGVSYVFSRAQRGSVSHFIEGGGFNSNRVRGLSDGAKPQPRGSDLVVTVAAGDKQSLQSGSLYWLRRDAMEALAKAGFKVMLVGPFWQEGLLFRTKQILHSLLLSLISGTVPVLRNARPRRFTSLSKSPNFKYLGYADDEIDFYKSGDVVLIIENDIESLSEKLFSALCSGRWVVYVGPCEASELPGVGRVLFSAPNVRAVTEAVSRALSSRAPSSGAERVGLERREFSSFYERVVNKVVAG